MVLHLIKEVVAREKTDLLEHFHFLCALLLTRTLRRHLFLLYAKINFLILKLFDKFHLEPMAMMLMPMREIQCSKNYYRIKHK